jgi:Domain of unknown function (DUF5916)/Carbohydrate family 9 binding domain-like
MRGVGIGVLLLLGLIQPAVAQQALKGVAPRPPAVAAPLRITAFRVSGGIAIDGRLDEPAWANAEVATNFVQFAPNAGAPASQRTVVRVLYDDAAVYVGARMFDTAPDSIIARLSRRDEPSVSDWLHVVIDSYFDRRTAFVFAVNPRGVKVDTQYSEDVNGDVGWDAVWDVATSVDSAGWVAEFRIPLSQLRFSGGGRGERVWGVNFRRYLARRDETDDWSPVPGSGGAFVSRAGELHGLRDLAPRRRLEIQPYVLSGVRRAPGDPADPLNDPTAVTSAVGADLRYGITSDLTLSATFNPDFGQVEADPSVVNLSGFETFFPEKRPFFLEGAEVFRPTFPQFPAIFHSRRVGRAPQGATPDDAVYASEPDATTILGAAKLTGKTSGGWSVGLFDAVTSREQARYADATGRIGSLAVEPSTNYGAWRVARDFGRGRSVLGVLATTVHRALPATGELNFLTSSAYVAGVDGLHRFSRGRVQIAGSFFGSRVAGSAEAIDSVQQSPVHRLNRVGAPHLHYDPTRTSLQGYSANLSAENRDGRWRFYVEGRARSPGFEANDLGYLGHADQISGEAHGWYDHFQAGRLLRHWRVDADTWTNWTFGGERSWTGGEAWGEAQLLNRWTVTGGVGHDFPHVDVDALRGGPAMRADALWWRWLRVQTDPVRAVNGAIYAYYQTESGTGGWSGNLNASVELRPSDRLSLTLGPSIERLVTPWQFVTNAEVDGETQYVRGRLNQTTVSLTLRAAYTFTPTLSLQAYAQPFISAGAYADFARVVAPRATRFADRIAPYDATQIGYANAGSYAVDRNRDGTADFTFANPDFTFRQLRSNVVLRWEYRPGSALFAVWSSGRTLANDAGRLRLGGDFADLLSAPGTNTLTVKMSYWIGR